MVCEIFNKYGTMHAHKIFPARCGVAYAVCACENFNNKKIFFAIISLNFIEHLFD